jgi:putative Mg2+ transporter-C (MgtC) family protein
MGEEVVTIVLRLAAAVAAGGIVGLERTYHGRPAGFRTHTLVCTASSLLMLVTVYESLWFPAGGAQRVVVDPTRMAQGIMTGIGFLGAGVIVREGLSVRGLTTAASIWITAAIGILVGIGFYLPAAVATAATLGTLSGFRWIEARVASELYSHFRVEFRRDAVIAENDLRSFITGYGFSIANLHHALVEDGTRFEYRMVLRTVDREAARALSDRLRSESSVVEFRISPVGE